MPGVHRLIEEWVGRRADACAVRDPLAERQLTYRAAIAEREGVGGWRGHVVLMVHTHLGEGEDEVRERVRGPLSAYLRSSLGLLLGSQPAGARNLDPSNLRERDVEFPVRRAFDRDYDGAGLLGTMDKARRTVDRLRGLQVDELACLIDFELPDEQVLGELDHLNRLRQLVAQGEAGDVAA